jgi:chorismate--pyruvate lyase
MVSSPIWHPAIRISQISLPAKTRAWLLAPGSTTKLFNSLSQQPMQVRCLQQRWHTPLRTEALCLNRPPLQKVLLREVELICDGDLWMYARTVMPAETLIGKYQQLKRLGTRPLGNILFRDPLMQRSSFEIAFLTPQHKEYQLAIRHLHKDYEPNGNTAENSSTKSLFARRSIFWLEHKPLLLTEVFLPACTNRLSEYVKKND